MNSTITKYGEIGELYDFSRRNGVHCTFERFMDGYCIKFNCGADAVQHKGSYGHNCGCVEFGYTHTDIDFKATALEKAKQFVLENKELLNKEI